MRAYGVIQGLHLCVITRAGRVGESIPRSLLVGDRTFAGLQHFQLAQGEHTVVDPKVMGREMSHDRAIKAFQFACQMIDATASRPRLLF